MANNKQDKAASGKEQAGAAEELYPETTKIEQEYPPRSPGFTRRAKRRREWIYLRRREILRASPPVSVAEAQEQAERDYEDLEKSHGGQRVLKEFEATAPTSHAVVPWTVRDEVELAATRWLGAIRWLISLLTVKSNKRGPTPRRSMVVAIFLQLAFWRCRPEIIGAFKALSAGRPLLNWAHGYPSPGPEYAGTCTALSKMLLEKPASAAIHANLELIRQLAERTDAKGKPLHPNIARWGVVDAMLVEAAIPQSSGRDKGHRRILHGPGRPKAQTVVYTRGGNVVRFCHGYKLMVLAELGATLPLVWSLVPANADERKEALRLVRRLFELWPGCPMEALIGDSLYDGSVDLASELVFRWGLMPIFPQGRSYSRHLPYVETAGIPVCACRQEMVFKDDNGHIYTAARRARLGIPRGQQAPRLDGRLRWKCANGNPRCKTVSTKPLDDPRLYTYYHRGGDHKLALQRRVLLLRRNAVESIFASLKHLGLGGRAVDRPSWADDDEMDWLLSAGLLFQTARRLVHETGLYEKAYDEAEALGFLEQPTKQLPAPGPSAQELAQATERRDFLPQAAPPRSWSEDPSQGGKSSGEPPQAQP